MNKYLQITEESVIDKIYLIRGKKVMLDRDLAKLYGVLTGNLNLAVKRNIERFPEDFMFQLTKDEHQNLILQFATSSSKWGGTRKLPFVFTEQGVAMLSSVLNSKQAIAVNIQIIRIFTRIREVLSTNKEIMLKLENLEKKLLHLDAKSKKHDEEIQLIFTYLKRLLNPEKPPMKKIGFKRQNED